MRGQIEQDLLDLRKAQAHGATMQWAMRGQLGFACPAMQTNGRYQRQNARVFFLRQYVKHAVQRQAENSVAQAAAVEEKQQANPASHYSLKVFYMLTARHICSCPHRRFCQGSGCTL